ncbi:MAG: prepilin-type N-terminal cleavage/methylation domain-containing protein [Eubacteriales bacterium]|nr:prepilin-type N-terminal cleavage/methylation domain-containing protein [Eubacteriales bacterium]
MTRRWKSQKRDAKNRRGFTLIELIVVVAILSILASVSVPSVNGYIGKSQAEVCRTNRLALQRYYQYIQILYPESTLSDILAGNYDNVIGTTSLIQCPAGGSYSIEEGHVVCSAHGGGEGDEIDPGTGGGGPAPTPTPPGPAVYDPDRDYNVGDVLFTDPNGRSVYLTADWSGVKKEARDGWGKQLENGGVYQDESGIYVQITRQYVSHDAGVADILLSQQTGMLKLDPSATILTQSDNNGRTWNYDKQPKLGDLYYYEGQLYVCAYPSSDAQWTATNPSGGGWIKLEGQPSG